MKPFRATYYTHGSPEEPTGHPEEVLVIKILPPLPAYAEPTVVFIHDDGLPDCDELSRFAEFKIPWPRPRREVQREW